MSSDVSKKTNTRKNYNGKEYKCQTGAYPNQAAARNLDNEFLNSFNRKDETDSFKGNRLELDRKAWAVKAGENSDTSGFESESTSKHQSSLNSLEDNESTHQDSHEETVLAKPLNSNCISQKGNIFYDRDNNLFVKNLPRDKQNAYFIQLEDDTCTGNEDMRTFLLTQLTNNGINKINCVSCYETLKIYDHFPITDGVLFLSPVKHLSERIGKTVTIRWNANVNAIHQYNNCQVKTESTIFNDPIIPPPGCSGPRQIQSSGVNKNSMHRKNGLVYQEKYLNGICGSCLHNKNERFIIACKFCSKKLDGKTIIYGSLYTYDIFAGEPCCRQRLVCKSCKSHPINRDQYKKIRSSITDTSQEVAQCPQENLLNPFPFYSQYSTKFTCSFCKNNDYHFVKTFKEIYTHK